jgi:4-alpha-glucanotransferase
MVDIVRFDHFRGYDRYWEIPSTEDTAKNGHWEDGPKMDLFNKIHESIPNAKIIAEDLGVIDDGVRKLLRDTGYPGMKVLIFGLKNDNEHSAYNWIEDCYGYTGTHDTNTIKGELAEMSNADVRNVWQRYNFDPNETVGMNAVKIAYASKAKNVIIPIADVFDLGAEARINLPNTIKGNWIWIGKRSLFTNAIAEKLANLVEIYS